VRGVKTTYMQDINVANLTQMIQRTAPRKVFGELIGKEGEPSYQIRRNSWADFYRQGAYEKEEVQEKEKGESEPVDIREDTSIE